MEMEKWYSGGVLAFWKSYNHLGYGNPRKWVKVGKVCQIYVFRNISGSTPYRRFGPKAKL